MTRQRLLRAAGACSALGALSMTLTLAEGAPAAPADTAVPAGRGPDVAIAGRRLNVLAGRRAVVRGRVAPATPGAAVALQRRSGRRWHTIDRARMTSDGRFSFRFRPSRTGSAAVQVRAGAAREHVGRLNVYRRTTVSWYGPGLFGGHLGCGGTLTPQTLGVAHKTLPCGTRVTLRHGSRTVRVRVVDRGPYVGGREFDLTSATRARLGFSGVGTLLVAHQ
ncbi:MAG: rare lipoprotein [Solirubrobacteraceae bacterium]|nr:rare lipoprotein [Solirubrobacteraceae bacterium]